MTDVEVIEQTVPLTAWAMSPEEASAFAVPAIRALAEGAAALRIAAELNPTPRNALRLFEALHPIAKIGEVVMIGPDAYRLAKVEFKGGELRVYAHRRLAGGRWSPRLSRVHLASRVIGVE